MFAKENRRRRSMHRELSISLALLFRHPKFLLGKWQLMNAERSWVDFSETRATAVREIQIDKKSYWITAQLAPRSSMEVLFNILVLWFLLPFMKNALVGPELQFEISGYNLIDPPLRITRETLDHAPINNHKAVKELLTR